LEFVKRCGIVTSLREGMSKVRPYMKDDAVQVSASGETLPTERQVQ